MNTVTAQPASSSTERPAQGSYVIAASPWATEDYELYRLGPDGRIVFESEHADAPSSSVACELTRPSIEAALRTLVAAVLPATERHLEDCRKADRTDWVQVTEQQLAYAYRQLADPLGEHWYFGPALLAALAELDATAPRGEIA